MNHDTHHRQNAEYLLGSWPIQAYVGWVILLIKGVPMYQNNTMRKQNSNPEDAAKALVFDHWAFLQKLTQKRFPEDDNMAHQALDFILEKLQENDWKRVRAWEGEGKFTTFLAVLAGRLMTDFVRARFGHRRPPAWLLAKKDPIWRDAYRSLMIEKYEREETVGLLQTRYPEHDPAKIRQLVATVIGQCNRQPQFKEDNVSIESVAESQSDNTIPEQSLTPDKKELLEILQNYIQGELDNIPASIEPMLNKLRSKLQLSDEDRLLLRLRFCEGLKMPTIKAMLGLSGDPYKRLNKLILQLQQACEEASLTPI